MYIAYSALPAHEPHAQNSNHHPQNTENEQLTRYQAYRAVCTKYHREITAIQKYIPGWHPKFY